MEKNKLKNQIVRKKTLKYSFAVLGSSVVLAAPLATIFATGSSIDKGKAKLGSAATSGLFDDTVPTGTTQKLAAANKTFLSTKILQSDFQFKGSNGNAVITVLNTQKFDHLDIWYSTNLANNSWSMTPPTKLNNGEIFYVRLQVKSADTNKFYIAPNLAEIKVSNLAGTIIQNPIDYLSTHQKTVISQDFFGFMGTESNGSVFLNANGIWNLTRSFGAGNPARPVVQGPGLDYRVEAQFKRPTENDSAWRPYITDLKSKETIQARIGIKKEFQNLYSLNNTAPANMPTKYDPISLVVPDLPATLPSNSQFDPNGLKFSGSSGSGNVSYQGYNATEPFTISKANKFINAWSYVGILANNDNGVYNYKDQGYKYLPSNVPFFTTYGAPYSESANIHTYQPYLYQKPGTTIKQAEIWINVLTTRQSNNRILRNPNVDLTNYLNPTGSQSLTEDLYKILINFDANGSYQGVQAIAIDSSGKPRANAQNQTFAAGKSSPTGGTYYTSDIYIPMDSANSRNYSYYSLFIDEKGNIGNAFNNYYSGTESGFVVTSTIKNASYNDGSAWSADTVDDLINGDFVNIEPSVGTATQKIARTAVAQVSNLPASSNLVPNLETAMFTFEPASGDLALVSTPAYIDHLGKVDLLYSTDGIDFASALPKTLLNNDFVFVKQNLKAGLTNFVLPDINLLKITVSGVNKKPATDTIIDTDFKFGGIQDTGSVALDSNKKTLPPQLEVQYSKNENGPFSTTSPSDLKNGETVYAKLFVTDTYADNYEVPSTTQAVPITVKDLPPAPLNDDIVSTDFEQSGAATSGSLKLKSSKSLASQIHVMYALNNGAYSAIVPTNLKNGDTVQLALQLNAGEENNYTLTNYTWTTNNNVSTPSKSVTYTVTGLPQHQLTDAIDPKDFGFDGTNESGTVTFGGASKLSPQVEVQYGTSENATDFSTTSPTNLKNGDEVWVKLVVKSGDSSNYALTAENAKAVKLTTVAGLESSELSDTIAAGDFSFDGTANDANTKQNKTLSDKVEVHYSKNATTGFSATPPKDLFNGGTLYAKLVVKQAYDSSYHLKSGAGDVVTISVTGLDKIKLPNTVALTDFETPAGTALSGTVALKSSVSLPAQVQVVYALENGTYSSTPPTNLKNGEKVYIALQVKSADAENYELSSYSWTTGANPTPSNHLEYSVSGLTPVNLTDRINSSAFKTSGYNTRASLVFNGLKTDGTNVAPQLEVIYSKTSGGTFGAVPTDLKNGDTVYAKLSVKATDADNYKLDINSQNEIPINISNLQQEELPDTLSQSDISVTGEVNNATVTLNKTLSNGVSVMYVKPGGGVPGSAIVPTDLQNGQTLAVYLVLDPSLSNSYKLKPNAGDLVFITISGLHKVSLDTDIVIGDFTTSGKVGSGTIVLNQSKVLEPQVQVFYAWPNGIYSTNPPAVLRNNDTVQIALQIKSEDALNYELKNYTWGDNNTNPSKSIPYTVTGLELFELTDSASAGDFTFGGEFGQGSPVFGGEASQNNLLKVSYSTDPKGPYSNTLNNLKNGDKIYAQLSVVDSSKDNFKLSDAASQPIPLTVSGLTLIELPDTLSPLYDFDQIGDPGKGTLSLKETLSNEVEIQYAGADGKYSPNVPTNLKNGDTVYAKLVVKPGSINGYKLKDGAGDPITISINKLAKINLNDTIAPEDFVFSGTSGSGIISLRPDKVIDPNLHVEYAFPQFTFYPTAPTTLKNGDDVHVALKLNDGADANYTYTNFLWETNGPRNNIVVPVSGLALKELSDRIDASAFTFSGDNEKGTGSYTKAVSSQTEVLYSRTETGPYGPVPNDLKNGETLYAQLSVKKDPAIADNFKLEQDAAKPVSLVVEGLKKMQVTDTLASGDFSFTGDANSGVVVLDPKKTLSSQSEVLYASSPNGTYSNTPPANLKNGDTVYVKVGIKDADQNGYEVDPANNAPIPVLVNGLNKIKLTDTIRPEDIAYSGKVLDSFTIGANPSKSLSPEVQLQYSKEQGGTYSPSAPTQVKNGDTIYAKLAPKDPENYEVSTEASTPVPVPISTLAKATITGASVNKDDFTIIKGTKDGTITVVPKTPVGNVEYEYGFADESGKVALWTKDAPTDVPDKPISVRVVPKDPANYEVPNLSTTVSQINNPDDTGLSPMAIAAIVLGSVAAAALTSVLGTYLRRFFRKNHAF